MKFIRVKLDNFIYIYIYIYIYGQNPENKLKYLHNKTCCKLLYIQEKKLNKKFSNIF
jgi:hypothetical protein